MPGCASWLFAAPQTIVARTACRPRRRRARRRVRTGRTRPGRASRRSAVLLDPRDSRLLVHDPVDGGLVDVRDDHGGTVLDEVVHEMAPDLAHAGDADRAPRQGRRAPRHLGGSAHALEDAQRRQHGGIPGATVSDGAAGHVVAFPGDVVHVLGEGPDVARRVVPTAEGLHEPPVGAQERLALDLRRVADDDGLAAAQVEAGEGGLVRHALREVEHVAQGVPLVGVRVEAGAAQARDPGRWSRWRRWPSGPVAWSWKWTTCSWAFAPPKKDGVVCRVVEFVGHGGDPLCVACRGGAGVSTRCPCGADRKATQGSRRVKHPPQ